jgi:transaldolase / glucose-6-phosphate isomerase
LSNPLVELNQSGQSIWFDQMESRLITEGTLKRMIDEDDLRGLTSNPTIFEKAIGGSSDYDAALGDLAGRDRNRFEILESLMVGDIGRAADLFRAVYDRTGGVDGMVSIEVSPTLAHDTEGTIAEGKKLFSLLDRPNVMIKVPATAEGLVAIEELIYSGINVNITLIFSREVYANVIEAYIRGLERRVAEGKPVDRIQSVASFFVSRIDSKADKALEEKIAKASGEEKRRLESLLGRIAIANAKMAYQLFLDKFSDARWKKLDERGAHVQRPLWASTGTKNPKYSDVLYLEELIGPNTVNTVPPATYTAFRDHGRVRRSIDEGVDEAKRQLEEFESAGLSLQKITEELTKEGVKSFADSFVSLVETIEARRADVVRSAQSLEAEHLGPCAGVVESAIAGIEKSKMVARIWNKVAAVWKDDADHQKLIANSLGWLTVSREMRKHVPGIRAFVEDVRQKFDDVVVLGMGGSSLCAEVLRTSFPRETGHPELHVLDSTVPEAVSSLEGKLALERTLFIVASKSGTTTEPALFYRYFFGRMRQRKGDRAGENFVAITDPSTVLESEAKADRFRKIFTNPADIGGRYSALSLFGLVPAALRGVDLDRWLDRAEEGMALCSTALPAAKNRGVRLGATMGALAREGRDKVTIVTGEDHPALGLWIEQLVAESTGKEGKGILPIALEPLGEVSWYGDDRLFVMIRDARAKTPEHLTKLQAAGHPLIERILRDPYDLAAEFFIWEFATAVAATFLGINPFDQPNVQEAKDITKSALDRYRQEKKLVTGDASPSAEVSKILSSLKKGDYVAFMAYFGESHERNELLSGMRRELMKKHRVATTSGYGPRFLHSTGQFHKGGTDNGVFIQLTADDRDELPIEGEPFSFGVVKSAQAIGDLTALRNRNRRTVQIHLGHDIEGGLGKLKESI